MDWFASPTCQAFLAGCGSWFSVTLGAAFIFLRKDCSRRAMDAQLGAAGGMMLAASFFGLLVPALGLTKSLGWLSFFPLSVGLLIGAVFIWAFDNILPHAHEAQGTTEGIETNWHQAILLVTAMALHHIPEGLSIGVGFGAMEPAAQFAEAGTQSVHIGTALVMSLSIMLQNIPEGLVVATALRVGGMPVHKCFFWGMISGATAPVGALLGLWTAGITAAILPVTLAFAAGAMIYIVVEEVIPEANASGNGNIVSVASILGVCVVLMFTSIFG